MSDSLSPHPFYGAASYGHGHLFALVRHDPVSRDAGHVEKSPPPRALLARGHAGPLVLSQSSIFGQNPKIGYQEFNDLQTPNLLKKQLCDRTVGGPARLWWRGGWHVRRSPSPRGLQTLQ